MSAEKPPFDQRIAAVLVRPLVPTPITPNHLSLLGLAVALYGCWLLIEPATQTLGAGLFALSRFLDHFDGELARQSGKTSKLGYYLDYLVGGISFAALFFAMGWAFKDQALGYWTVVLGTGGSLCAIFSMFTNLGIDKQAGADETGDAVGYPGFAGVELEDGIYLIWPIAWLGYLYPFSILASAGATVYFLWTCMTLIKGKKSA